MFALVIKNEVINFSAHCLQNTLSYNKTVSTVFPNFSAGSCDETKYRVGAVCANFRYLMNTTIAQNSEVDEATSLG